MFIKTILCSLFLLILCTGCMPYWREVTMTNIFPKGYHGAGFPTQDVQVGFTKEEVLAATQRRPEGVEVHGNREVWMYNDLLSNNRKVQLTFIDGKVSKIREFRIEAFF